MSTTESSPPRSGQDWEEVQSAADFQELRRRLRTFVFPVTGIFLAWYLVYVLMSSYAPSIMSIKVFGNVNVGLLFGLLQFVSTFGITAWYVHYANRKLDPLASKLRDQLEEERR
ncbi:MAG TPA: DUF485 domain-containing protein [Pseudonocardia sp.]|jgi:uncharacterized membrane protein (DUF485 family)|uniref:DUF485 domain-containing protein n=1 Tax=Pseudonocardia sp. TaxID=60912 RepID=UPI002CB698F6|nr:DUF485 domain-containing protein [Pseudonocardia sp.]HTF47033.1 DUF485 domain-containing protein [Pseudonocardia sp.]